MSLHRIILVILNIKLLHHQVLTDLDQNLQKGNVVIKAVKDTFSEHAIVLYDLTKMPPIVKTANDTFCKMLGYDMDDVIGQPWVKFVHPSMYDRTFQIFSARKLSTVIEFNQYYKHKNGGAFSTVDSHTIIFDGHTPVSDLVTIKLARNNINENTEKNNRHNVPNSTYSVKVVTDQPLRLLDREERTQVQAYNENDDKTEHLTPTLSIDNWNSNAYKAGPRVHESLVTHVIQPPSIVTPPHQVITPSSPIGFGIFEPTEDDFLYSLPSPLLAQPSPTHFLNFDDDVGDINKLESNNQQIKVALEPNTTNKLTISDGLSDLDIFEFRSPKE